MQSVVENFGKTAFAKIPTADCTCAPTGIRWSGTRTCCSCCCTDEIVVTEATTAAQICVKFVPPDLVTRVWGKEQTMILECAEDFYKHVMIWCMQERKYIDQRNFQN